jgi:hypothetical protein
MFARVWHEGQQKLPVLTVCASKATVEVDCFDGATRAIQESQIKTVSIGCIQNNPITRD